MKAITSKAKLLAKLKKNNLLHSCGRYYLSDFHKSNVGQAVANKVINEKLVEPTRAMASWFEDEWKLKKE